MARNITLTTGSTTQLTLFQQTEHKLPQLSDDVLDRLDAGITALTTSQAWTSWLRTQRRFWTYSFQNSLLITLQCPEATRVAGFSTWKTLGRHVRKGEKGIRILAPIVRRQETEDDEQRVIGFRPVAVFDISQTDGEELPAVPCHRLTGEAPTEAFTALVEVAEGLGYTVEGGAWFGGGAKNGDCNFQDRRIRIAAGIEPAQALKTLAHELAHAMLHENAESRALAELEAESIAFVVCDALGIDSGDYTFGYVASWAGGGDQAREAIKASGSRIATAARTILAGLNEQRREAA